MAIFDSHLGIQLDPGLLLSLTLELMEALQILKFALKKDRLNFTGHLHLPEFMLIPSDDKRTKLSKMLDMDINRLTAHLDSVDFAD